MNLETHIAPALWNAIRSSYESRNYTGAILDAVYVVTEVLREKADSQADGVALVANALSGSNPAVKVTPLRSESDWNEQRGIEHILRGGYQGIRNPRSHGKRGDTEEVANAIILFLDYLLRQLGQAATLFSKADFLERVFDPHFPKKTRYAELLVEEIPAKYLIEVFHDVYQRREEGDGEALQLIIQALVQRLSEDERQEIWTTISADLRTASGFDAIKTVVQVIKPEQWPNLTEVARLRIENRFIQDIKDARYDAKTNKCRGAGALGTWCTALIPHFTLKDELASALMTLLGSGDRQRSDYVFQFFFRHLENLAGKQNQRLRRILVNGMQSGDKRFHDIVLGIFDDEPDPDWGEKVIEAANGFQEKSQDSPFDVDDDDLPF